MLKLNLLQGKMEPKLRTVHLVHLRSRLPRCHLPLKHLQQIDRPLADLLLFSLQVPLLAASRRLDSHPPLARPALVKAHSRLPPARSLPFRHHRQEAHKQVQQDFQLSRILRPQRPASAHLGSLPPLGSLRHLEMLASHLQKLSLLSHHHKAILLRQ